jgi:hypothetical protein
MTAVCSRITSPAYKLHSRQCVVAVSSLTSDITWGRSSDILHVTYVVRERRMDMLPSVLWWVPVVLFTVVGMVHVARLVNGVLVWHRQTRRAEIRAHIAAAEIQRMLSGRARSLNNGH